MLFTAAAIIQRSLLSFPIGWAIPLPWAKSFRINLSSLLLIGLYIWFLRDKAPNHDKHHLVHHLVQ
jgi:hypothetical protein